MNFLRFAVISGSLLTTLMTASCLGFLISPTGDRSSAMPDTADARIALGALTRGQQAYYLENGRFAETIAEVSNVISAETGGYQIAIAELQSDRVIMTAKTSALPPPNLSAGVFVLSGDRQVMTSLICEGPANSENPPPLPQVVGSELVCGNSP